MTFALTCRPRKVPNAHELYFSAISAITKIANATHQDQVFVSAIKDSKEVITQITDIFLNVEQTCRKQCVETSVLFPSFEWVSVTTYLLKILHSAAVGSTEVSLAVRDVRDNLTATLSHLTIVGAGDSWPKKNLQHRLKVLEEYLHTHHTRL